MNIVKLLFFIALCGFGAACTGCGLKSPSEDSGNSDEPNPGSPDSNAKESIAAFEEVGKVLTSPRCINCHPSGERPTQGDKMQPHQPPVFRGAGGKGAVGMRCSTCHATQNYAFVEGGSIPGAKNWHLAPASMAWQGKSLHEICEQIKDPARNGGKTLEQLLEHHTKDGFVLWAWKPGAERSPAPGTHAQFVEWTRKWIESGAHCPPAS